MSKLFGTLADWLFSTETFGHDVLNIVHDVPEYRTSLDWRLCYMRGAVFHHAVSSWHCSVLIKFYIEGE